VSVLWNWIPQFLELQWTVLSVLGMNRRASCMVGILSIILLWMNTLLERGSCVPRSRIAKSGFTVALFEQVLHSDICEKITHDQNPHCCIPNVWEGIYLCVRAYIHVYKCVKYIASYNYEWRYKRIQFYLNLIALPQRTNSDIILIMNLCSGYKKIYWVII
jgi:hypothetical protein